jgi:nucleoside-diphosphate-sugar epimerase
MTKTISVLGCGWLGKPLALKLSDNYVVKASNRTHENRSTFEHHNIIHYIIDIQDESLVRSEFLKADILVLPITHKNSSDFKRLIASIERSSIKQVIFISSTSVYENKNTIVTEETPTNSSDLAQIEQLFLKAKNFDTTLIRFAGLYGYNRNPVNFISSTKTMSNPEGYINLIHRDDCIAIIEKIISENLGNTVFNACCSSHPKRKDFYTGLATKYGKPLPEFEATSKDRFKIVSNDKLVHTLNYTFIHNDLTTI